MSCINTVTIGLDEWDKLKERDRMLTKLENDPNAFAIFLINDHYRWALPSKNIVLVGEDILRTMEAEIKDLKSIYESDKEQWRETVNKLRAENIELRRKKWWQIW